MRTLAPILLLACSSAYAADTHLTPPVPSAEVRLSTAPPKASLPAKPKTAAPRPQKTTSPAKAPTTAKPRPASPPAKSTAAAPGAAPAPRKGPVQVHPAKKAAPAAKNPVQKAELVVSTVPVSVIYPKEGHLLDGPGRQFVLGSVSHPMRPFRINGSTVTVHRKGGFLTYLPVSAGTFTFRCELDLPGGTTTFLRTVRVADPAPTLAPDSTEIVSESLQPSEAQELRPGDRLPVRLRGTPGLSAQFSVEGLGGPFPMVETSPGLYEGVYLVRPNDRCLESEIAFVLSRGSASAKASARGRLTVATDPPATVAVRSSANPVSVRIAPGRSYILFPSSGTLLSATGRGGASLRVALGQGLSGWIEEKSVERLPRGTPPPSAVLGTLRTSAGEGVTTVLMNLSQKVPFLVEERSDLAGLRLRVFNAVPHVNWIVYDPADRFVEQLRWIPTLSDTVEVEVVLARGKILWGHNAYWLDKTTLALELRHPPKLAGHAGSPLKGLRVIVDPGHMPSAPGAVGPKGTLEMDVNYAIAQDLAAMLRKEGAIPVVTRESPEHEVSLPDRVLWGQPPDLFVSVHNNALPDGENPFERPRGFSVFYYQPHSLKLARAVYRAYGRHVSLPGESLRYGDLFVARATQVPAILTESAYMMFPDQEQLLLESSARRKFAAAMLEGMRDFLEEERRRQESFAPPAAPQPKPVKKGG